LLISFVCNFASWGLGRLLTPFKTSIFKLLF
jgi:hypothetical protein